VEQRVEKKRKIAESVWVHNVVTVRTGKVAGQCGILRAFLLPVVAKLSDLKNSPVFWPTLYIVSISCGPKSGATLIAQI